MGGAMAMYFGLGYRPDLAGVFAMSSFLNEESLVYKVNLSKSLHEWTTFRSTIGPLYNTVQYDQYGPPSMTNIRENFPFLLLTVRHRPTPNCFK